MKNLLRILALSALALAVVAALPFGQGPLRAEENHAEEDGHADDHAGGGEHHDAVALTPEQMAANQVEVSVAGPGELLTRLALPGEVRLNEDRVAHVVPRVAGVVREVFKTVGDRVAQGERLAILDSRELAELKAAYLAAGEREELAKSNFLREKQLRDKGISAEQDFLTAKQVMAEAAIATRSAEQQLHAVGFSEAEVRGIPGQEHVSYTRHEITAPFDGTVIERHITLGEYLKDDASCFTIADLGTVWVDLNVYQKDLAGVRSGQEALVSPGSDPSDGTPGTIAYVGPVMGEETRAATARIVLPNEAGQWRPGQFVTGFVSAGRETVPVLVPRTALQTVEGVLSVFIETDGEFVPSPVTTGRGDGALVEILTGLPAGGRYASAGSFIMKAMLEKGEAHQH